MLSSKATLFSILTPYSKYSLLNTKIRHRLLIVSQNAMRQIVVSSFGMLVPFMVIGYGSKDLWGTFVSVLLFSLWAVQIINWGNKEYLLRQFSLSPATIAADFSRSLYTRLPLVALFSIIGFGIYPIWIAISVAFWLLGRFMYHSTEALILFENRFNSATIIETGGFAIFVFLLIVGQTHLDPSSLVMLYSGYQLAKGGCYLSLFKRHFKWAHFKMDWQYFGRARAFLLLSFTGFLASKIDLYLVERLGNTALTADYQIVNSMLLFTMSLAPFLYGPFTSNLYRNNGALLNRMRRLLAVTGLAVVPIALVLIGQVSANVLSIELSFTFYVIGFAYVFPSFIYGIDIVHLFKLRKETTVTRFLFCGVVLSAVLSGFGLYTNGSMLGALAGSAAAQVFVWALFMWKVRPMIKSRGSAPLFLEPKPAGI